LECGGKRSATPPWISFAVQRKEIQSGVALRLPPHSKGYREVVLIMGPPLTSMEHC
jgi:hypothetical protein